MVFRSLSCWNIIVSGMRRWHDDDSEYQLGLTESSQFLRHTTWTIQVTT